MGKLHYSPFRNLKYLKTETLVIHIHDAVWGYYSIESQIAKMKERHESKEEETNPTRIY